jgi:hypothetical protein
MVPLVEAEFPATSKVTAFRSYVPSVEVLNEAPPPLMLTDPTPELESEAEAEAVTDETCQPFDPSGAGMESETEGGTLSRRMVAEAMAEVSP